jgi:penicillin-binding protein 1A
VALAGTGALAVLAAALTWLLMPSVADLEMSVQARLAPLGQREVPLTAIAPVLRQAVIATEDGRFHAHRGIDTVGLARALAYDIGHFTLAQGASTITEQLAKLLYLGGDDRPPWRKLEDALLAIRLETRYSKEQILDAYLNTVSFGDGRPGIAAASMRIFARPPAELTLAQASLLAGLAQAPSAYDPLTHPLRARARQVTVLRSMIRNGQITVADGQRVLQQPLQLADGRRVPAIRAPNLAPAKPFVWGLLLLGVGILLAAVVLVILTRGSPHTLGYRAAITLLLGGGAVLVFRSFQVV